MKCDLTPEWKFACQLFTSIVLIIAIVIVLTMCVPDTWYSYPTGYL